MLALAASLILCAPGMAAKAHADDPIIGRITTNDHRYEYSTYTDLKQYLEGLRDKEITVEMFGDWILPNGSDEERANIIPTFGRKNLRCG